MNPNQKTALLALIESIREVGASHQYDNEHGVQNKHYLMAAEVMHAAADRVEALFELEESK